MNDDNKQQLIEREKQGYNNLNLSDLLNNPNLSFYMYSRNIANKDYRLQIEIYNNWIVMDIIKEITKIYAIEYNEPLPNKDIKLANKNNWKNSNDSY